jgi:hypothetical protein
MDEDTLEATIDTLSIAKRLGSYLATRASTDELKQIGQTVILRADKLSEKLQAKRMPQGTEEIPHIEVSNITATTKPNQNSVITHVMPPSNKVQKSRTDSTPTNILPHIQLSEKNGTNPRSHNIMTGLPITKLPTVPIKQARTSRKIKLQKGPRNTIRYNMFPYNGPKINADSYYATASVPNTAVAAGGARRRHR